MRPWLKVPAADRGSVFRKSLSCEDLLPFVKDGQKPTLRCVATRRQRQWRIRLSGHPSILIPGITSVNVIKLWGIHFTLYTSAWKHLISEVADFYLQDVDIRNHMKRKRLTYENIFNIWARIRDLIGCSSNTGRKEKYSLDVFATPAPYLGNR